MGSEKLNFPDAILFLVKRRSFFVPLVVVFIQHTHTETITGTAPFEIHLVPIATFQM